LSAHNVQYFTPTWAIYTSINRIIINNEILNLQFIVLMCKSKLRWYFCFKLNKIVREKIKNFPPSICFIFIFLTDCLNFYLLLAHLSWKLKWAFLIAFCMSSVCPSVWRLMSEVCLLDFYIFNFFSRTAGPILTKVGTNHP
jgi:hypothetical protein